MGTESNQPRGGFAPDLELVWKLPPFIPGDPSEIGGAAGGGGTPAPPGRSPYAVDIGGIWLTEHDLLTALSSQIADYNELKQRIRANGPMARPEEWGLGTQHKINSGDLGTTYWYETSAETREFAEKEEALLTACADIITLVGNWVALMNDAAQAYFAASENSTPPAP